ncbi:hypothetical protein [Bradyrhizobium liaoningense]|uniref:hypothetical protein n=1 Tax=Bradyrhizobium liaoningense TaxID=43992 RepID=UPI001BA44627|nr:hypothetical protein [Bradyrhizobium liaoningense]MBR1170505.1 hypothetical protein [Bradyrhizobium liaoningense]
MNRLRNEASPGKGSGVSIIMAGALQRDLVARGIRQFDLADCEAMIARMFDSVRTIERHTRQAFDDAPAKRCETELVDRDGSCEACRPIQGEACQKPPRSPA